MKVYLAAAAIIVHSVAGISYIDSIKNFLAQNAESGRNGSVLKLRARALEDGEEDSGDDAFGGFDDGFGGFDDTIIFL